MGLPQIASGSCRRRQILGEGTASFGWGEMGGLAHRYRKLFLCALLLMDVSGLGTASVVDGGWAMQQAAEAAFSCRSSQPMSLENPRDTQLLARRVVGEIAPSTTYWLED